jgi:uncharacterized coiled-coil protein SlyX
MGEEAAKIISLLSEIHAMLAAHTLRFDRIEEELAELKEMMDVTGVLDEEDMSGEQSQLSDLLDRLEELSPEELDRQITAAAMMLGTKGGDKKKPGMTFERDAQAG